MNIRLVRIVSLLLLHALGARAQTMVNTWLDQQDVPAGAELSLREAIRDARGGEVIAFDPIVFTGATGRVIRINADWGRLLVQTNLVLDATAIPGGVELSGESRTGVLRVDASGNCQIRGLRFVDGKSVSDGHGAAILNRGVLQADRCHFARNVAPYLGGAIYSTHSLTLTHCVFEANRAQSGAGIRNQGALTATGCTFFDNVADGGNGGALANEGSALLVNSTFTGNVSYYGAGLFNFSGPMHLHHCTVFANIAAFGGGHLLGLEHLLPLHHCFRQPRTDRRY